MLVHVRVDAPWEETLRVAPAGDVDQEGADALGSALDGAVATGAGRVVLDLREVGVFGAAAIGEVARVAGLLEARGATLVVRPGRAIHARVLHVTGFRHLLA